MLCFKVLFVLLMIALLRLIWAIHFFVPVPCTLTMFAYRWHGYEFMATQGQVIYARFEPGLSKLPS